MLVTREIKTGVAPRRAARIVALACAAVLLLAVVHQPLLRGVANFLVVEDPLQPAAAIVALAGQTPFREMEAANLYRAGWAPKVILVRGARSEEARTLEEMGIAMAEGWHLSREVLLRQGVPAAAIVVPDGAAEGTLEELQAALAALEPKTSRVILVTSKYHSRRSRLTWSYVTDGRSQGIVRFTDRDPFDPKRWWRQRGSVLSVVREYLGLINYYAGFPVGAGGS